MCKTLLPTLCRAAAGERVRLVYASDGDPAEHVAFAREQALDPASYVLSRELGLRYEVAKLPYAVLIDAAGIVRAKGIVNTREHIESLFEAERLGMPTIQAHLALAAADLSPTRKGSPRDRPRRADRARRARARAPDVSPRVPRAPRHAAGRRRGAAAAAGRARRGGGRARPAPDEDIAGAEGDPTRCEYWRHCAIDGFACACCGGSASACPPGTEKSPVGWVGTCRNPADGKDYIISYNDCCGKGWCGRCGCNRNEGERPDYHWVRNNDINWCVSAKSLAYHCSVAIWSGRRRSRSRSDEHIRAACARRGGSRCSRASAAAPRRRRGEDYLLHCSGCHQADGAGVPGVVPPLSGLAPFLATPAGRAYLVRVPGVAQAPLDDERLAALLNWVMREMSGAQPSPAYDAREVARAARAIRCAMRAPSARSRSATNRRPRARRSSPSAPSVSSALSALWWARPRGLHSGSTYK